MGFDYFSWADNLLSEPHLPLVQGHCGHLLMFAEEDVPERGIKKGEPYCLKCPSVSLLGEHCCINAHCESELLKHKERMKELWNQNHPNEPIAEAAESLALSFPPQVVIQIP